MAKYPSWHPDMKKTHKILSPQMSPYHFALLEQVFRIAGFDFDILSSVNQHAVELGQRYVNNDMCYPCILVTGQLLEAVDLYKSNPSNTKPVAVIMSKTGGGCRASNYASVIRKALYDKGHRDVPVAELNFTMKSNLGVGLGDLNRAAYAILLGDVIMTCVNRVSPYIDPDERKSLDEWTLTLLDIARTNLPKMNKKTFEHFVTVIVTQYERLIPDKKRRPQVGIVGEILVQYHPGANGDLPRHIERRGCESVVPPIANFFLYCMTGVIFQHKLLGTSLLKSVAMKAVIGLIERRKAAVRRVFAKSAKFSDLKNRWNSIYDLAGGTGGIVSLVQSMGEGWLIAAELVELSSTGVTHNVIAQPFACLPNKVIGEGIVKEVKRRFPGSNIQPLDYDPGASKTNIDNRLQLLIDELTGVLGRPQKGV